MSVELQGEGWPLSSVEAVRLWQEARSWRESQDVMVVARAVSAEEMRDLNQRYRGKDYATNVLTFSYGEDEHDMAICLTVAAREAGERQMSERDYVALLLVHGFLHVLGMDHERSVNEKEETQEAERAILAAAGFSDQSL